MQGFCLYLPEILFLVFKIYTFLDFAAGFAILLIFFFMERKVMIEKLTILFLFWFNIRLVFFRKTLVDWISGRLIWIGFLGGIFLLFYLAGTVRRSLNKTKKLGLKTRNLQKKIIKWLFLTILLLATNIRRAKHSTFVESEPTWRIFFFYLLVIMWSLAIILWITQPKDFF